MENLMNLKSGSIFTWALRGAGLSFVALLLFVTTLMVFGNVLTNKSLLENIWQFFPLVTGTLGGAMGGLSLGIIQKIGQSKVSKFLAFGIGLIIYLVVVWMCLVLGFSAIGQWD